MQGTGQGCFVFSWGQVELDGLAGSPPATMHVGANWRWQGSAMRVDAPGAALRLAAGAEHLALQEKAARQVRRLFGAELAGEPELSETDPPGGTFELTDGTGVWLAMLVEGVEGGEPLVMFRDRLPEPDRDYWVLRQDVGTATTVRGHGMICFVPGTLLDTPQGPRPVEDIMPGDCIGTRDDGPQTVIWRAARQISGSRIIAMPDLRPIRIRTDHFGLDAPRPDLFVSPDHRILLTGAAARELFGTDEVLIAARDLIGRAGISADNRARPVEYIHLMLDRHQVLRANGIDCESFHPAAADLEALGAGERGGLESLLPAVARDPMQFGDYARRLLNRAEAALLLHGLGRAPLPGH